MREPKHACPSPPSSELAKVLDGIHKTQSGARRHRCAACAYAYGFREGRTAAEQDRRVSAWTMSGPAEMCEDGRSAPRVVLEALEENQGEHRHGCAVCAWAFGWRGGVAAVAG